MAMPMLADNLMRPVSNWKPILKPSRILSRHDLGIGRAFEAFEHHDELVAAVAGEGVDLAGEGPDPCGGFAEDAVARAVAIGVVDLLEVVEIDEHEPENQPAATGSGNRSGELRVKRPAIEQPGQRVFHRERTDVLLGLFAAEALLPALALDDGVLNEIQDPEYDEAHHDQPDSGVLENPVVVLNALRNRWTSAKPNE